MLSPAMGLVDPHGDPPTAGCANACLIASVREFKSFYTGDQWQRQCIPLSKSSSFKTKRPKPRQKCSNAGEPTAGARSTSTAKWLCRLSICCYFMPTLKLDCSKRLSQCLLMERFPLNPVGLGTNLMWLFANKVYHGQETSFDYKHVKWNYK